MHLYIARVMQALIFQKSAGIFPQYFFIKHLLPPYSLYYYLLIALAHGMSFVVADKTVTCLYVVLFLFGFRYLARAVGANGEVLALCAAPLALNWPLAMGFLNFCVATSLAFWALGLWCRISKTQGDPANRRRLMAFVALCVVIMLTHPVPLLLVLGFCYLDLSVRILRFTRRGAAWLGATAVSSRKLLLRDLCVLLVASSTLAYVKAFTVSHAWSHNGSVQTPYLFNRAGLSWILSERSLLMFGGKTAPILLFRGFIYLFALAALFLSVRELLRAFHSRRWTLGNTWTLAFIGLGILSLTVPPDLNNSGYFAARLILLVWLGALVAASGASTKTTAPARWRSFAITACVAGLAATALGFLLAIHVITPVAAEVATIETVPLPVSHRVFLMLESPDFSLPRELYFDPFRWSAGRIARRTDSVIYNTPWLTLPIIPLGARSDMATDKFDLSYQEVPSTMRQLMIESPESRATILHDVDAVLIDHGMNKQASLTDPLLTPVVSGVDRWDCSLISVFSVCTSAGATPRPR